jgi:pimeloyl-ACP methyl ester carboxylesterase
VVLLHGSADTPAAWQGVVAALGADWQAVTPTFDVVMSGSAIDADLPWLDQRMAATGARVLAAHSYGALLALRWALAHPERLDRLVLAEPIAWGLVRDRPEVRPVLETIRDKFQQAELTASDEAGLLHVLADYWNGPGFWARLPERVRAALHASLPRTRAEVVSGGSDLTSVAEVGGLRVPTVVLMGEQTPVESAQVSRTLAAALPDGRLVVLQGAGHQFLRTHPEEVAAAIRGQAGDTRAIAKSPSPHP